MRHFASIQEVQITQDSLTRARSFAEQVTPTVNYADTHQANRYKVRHDHFISKVGEEAVKTIFEKLNHRVRGPDYTIYAGKGKSWEADLFIDDVPLAVKTQTAEAGKRFELSWTFQLGPYRRDPILNQPDAWVCFVEYDEPKNLCRVFPPYQIKELTFEAPKLARLQKVKIAVYARTFKF